MRNNEHALVDTAGDSPTHAALSARLASLLDQGLPQDSPCIVYSSDVKLKLGEDHSLGVSFLFDAVYQTSINQKTECHVGTDVSRPRCR